MVDDGAIERYATARLPAPGLPELAVILCGSTPEIGALLAAVAEERRRAAIESALIACGGRGAPGTHAARVASRRAETLRALLNGDTTPQRVGARLRSVRTDGRLAA